MEKGKQDNKYKRAMGGNVHENIQSNLPNLSSYELNKIRNNITRKLFGIT